MESLNIYQMYVANGEKTGFFVRRDSWGSVYARIRTIGGQEEGPLAGEPPYHGNPEVIMDVFSNDGTLKNENEVMSCPGTYAYSQIKPSETA